MTSQRKIEANRRNALKSSGPKSPAAKSRVSRNAYRHGLAALTHRDVGLSHDIERLARLICGGRANPLLIAEARTMAESVLMLKLVVAEQIAVIERMRDVYASPLTAQHEAIPRAVERGRAFDRAADELEALEEAFDALLENAREELFEEDAREVARLAAKPARLNERDEVDAMRAAYPDLARLSRYERRARSRLRRAQQRFIEIAD